MKLNPRTVLTRTTAATAAAAVGVLAVFATPASAAVPVGQVTVVSSTNGTTPKGSGGSQDTWQLRLPTGAACTKDTATNAYHVYTFIAPSSIDPTTLTWDSGGPHDATNNPNVFPLFDNGGNPFIATATVPVSAIVPNPQPQGGTASFSWAFFSTDGTGGTTNPLAPGAYNVGIACVDNNSVTDKIWDVPVTFTANAGDPNGETWVATNPTPQVPESPLAIALPVSAVAILAGGYVVLRRRRSTGATPAV